MIPYKSHFDTFYGDDVKEMFWYYNSIVSSPWQLKNHESVKFLLSEE
jgi:hypothetical protein